MNPTVKFSPEDLADRAGIKLPHQDNVQNNRDNTHPAKIEVRDRYFQGFEGLKSLVDPLCS